MSSFEVANFKQEHFLSKQELGQFIYIWKAQRVILYIFKNVIAKFSYLAKEEVHILVVVDKIDQRNNSLHNI